MSKTYQELIEEIKTDALISIAMGIKNQTAPFLRHQEPENMARAYNGGTGASYSGINSLLLDLKKAEKGYKENIWINAIQAQRLGADEKEINNAKGNWKEDSVKIHYIQKYKTEPIVTDKPLYDENGNQKLLKDGSPAYEFAKDEYGNIKTETIKLEQPILRVDRLYNIENFPSIDRSKIKDLNPELEQRHIYRATQDKKGYGVILQDIGEKLTPVTKEQIEEYFKAQNFHKPYDVTKGLNERQKEQVKALLNEKETQTQEKTQENKEEKKQEKTKAKTSRGKSR